MDLLDQRSGHASLRDPAVDDARKRACRSEEKQAAHVLRFGPAGIDLFEQELRCLLLHARIPIGEVRTFWAEVQALARRFAQIPRSGDQVYGFAAGLYPTDAPTLPDPDPQP